MVFQIICTDTGCISFEVTDFHVPLRFIEDSVSKAPPVQFILLGLDSTSEDIFRVEDKILTRTGAAAVSIVI